MDPLFERLRERLRRHPGRSLDLPALLLRESAVLVPLFLREGRPHLLFTRRPPTLKSHGGQISFPGGVREQGDLTPLHTALRETKEELGIAPELVEVLGMLDEIPTITRYRILPFVGVIPGELRYLPSAEEIEEIIEAPLSELEERAPRFFYFGRHLVWGATARILHNLLAQLLASAKEGQLV